MLLCFNLAVCVCDIVQTHSAFGRITSNERHKLALCVWAKELYFDLIENKTWDNWKYGLWIAVCHSAW